MRARKDFTFNPKILPFLKTMNIIKELPNELIDSPVETISLKVERRVLAKRRWRGQSTDGMDFGFDLEIPMSHGDCFFIDENVHYSIEQLPEEVFVVPYLNSEDAAHRAWQIGNLHFPAQFTEKSLLVERDLAVKQMLDRNDIPYENGIEVFEPVVATSGHHHHPSSEDEHSHSHSHEH